MIIEMMMPSTLVMPFGTSKVDTPFFFIHKVSFGIAEHLSTPGDHERSTTRRILTGYEPKQVGAAADKDQLRLVVTTLQGFPRRQDPEQVADHKPFQEQHRTREASTQT